MKDKTESKPDAGAFYVGIDVSKDKLAVYAGDLFEGEIENNRSAIGRLVRDLRRKAGKRPASTAWTCIWRWIASDRTSASWIPQASATTRLRAR